MGLREMKLKIYSLSTVWGRIVNWITGLAIIALIILTFSKLFQTGFFTTIPGAILLILALTVLLLQWFLISMWNFVTFRYIVYFFSWVISLIRRFFHYTLVQFVLVFGGTGFLVLLLEHLYYRHHKIDIFNLNEWLRYLFFQNIEKKIFSIDRILDFKFILITSSLTILFFIISWLFRAREIIIIYDFNNHTGEKNLEEMINGIPYRIISEIIRLRYLYKMIDEIEPQDKSKRAEPTVSIKDMGHNLEEFGGENTELQVIPGVKVNLAFIMRILQKAAHGPKLCGCLQREGNRLVLVVWISGGKMKGTWHVQGEAIGEFATANLTRIIAAMVEEMSYKIFTKLADVGSPRWQAVKYYSQGLRMYRETVLSKENRKIQLREAKTNFKKALAEDITFSRCYYNLGIIYLKLENEKSAEAAFHKALGVNPVDYDSFYQLARIYNNRGDYANAEWFCEQAIQLQPSCPRGWNLKVYILFDKWFEKKKEDFTFTGKLSLEKGIFEPAFIAVLLSWRELCKARLYDRINHRHKHTARTAIRSLAIVNGLKNHWISWLFHQAFFISPNDNELFFEFGKYYYRRYVNEKKKHRKSNDFYCWRAIKKSQKNLFRVYEDYELINEPLRFWATYSHVHSLLYKKKKEEKYYEITIDGFYHFLCYFSFLLHSGRPDQRGETSGAQVSELTETRLTKYKDMLADSFAALTKDQKEKNEKETEPGTETGRQIIPQKEIESIPSILKIRNLLGSCKTCDEIKQIYQDEMANSSNLPGWSIAQVYIAFAKRMLVIGKSKLCASMLFALSLEKLQEIHLDEIKKNRLHYFLTDGYLQLQDLEKALFHAQEAVRLNPFEPRERLLLGRVHIALENYTRAVTELEISFRLDPDNPEILKALGEAYKGKGWNACNAGEMKRAFGSAREIFTQALEIMGSNSFLDDKESDHPLSEKWARDEDKQYVKNLGLINYNLGYFWYEDMDYDRAAAHYRAAAQMGHEPVHSLTKAGWSYVIAGSYYRADQTFCEAMELNRDEKNRYFPYFIETRLGKCAALFESKVEIRDKKTGKFAEAQKWLENQAGLEMKELQQLFDEAKEIMRSSKERAEVNQKLPMLEKKVKNEHTGELVKDLMELRKRSKLKEEIEWYDKYSPLLWFMYYETRGLMYAKLEQYERALEEFERAADYRANARIYYRMARVYYRLASDKKVGKAEKTRILKREDYIFHGRTACELCCKNDLRQGFMKEVEALLKDFETLEKKGKGE